MKNFQANLKTLEAADRIISPEGKHLGTIIGPEHPHNMAWGDGDGKTLYLCAQTGLYRIRLNVSGIRLPLAQRELAKR